MTIPDATATIALAPRRTPRRNVIGRALLRPLAATSTVVLLIIVIACLGAPLWAPYDPLANDLSNSLAAPSLEHLLGTDQLGRDVFSRLLYGGVPAFIAALQVSIVAMLLAIPIGVISGYAGGRTDGVLMRVVDFGLAVPNLIFVLVIISIFGDDLQIAYFALGVLLVPAAARIIRGAALNVRGELFIDAARVSGVGTVRIAFRHVVPRVIGPILVQASLITAIGIVLTGGLAYLGFGPKPPEPSWGGLIGESLSIFNRNPWVLIGVGTVMGVTVLCLGLIGDAIRDETVEAWSAAPRRPARPRRTTLAAHPAQVDPPAAPRTDGALLQVRDVEISYSRDGRSTAVARKVGFCVDRGEIVGLVGESGCGKTTVARSILGLLRGSGAVTGGSIEFDGIRLDELTPDAFRALRGNRIAFVSQEPMASLDPSMKVGHLVASNVRRNTGVDKAAARARTIELFGLVQIREPERVFELYPHQVSGGMAQRIAIARALSGDPDLLVADEPTTALDVSVQAEVLDLLRELRDRTGMGILLVTHDWGVVSEICDRAIVMYAGEVVEEAPVAMLTSEPLHPYTAALLRSNPSMVDPDLERLPTIAGSIPPPDKWPDSCRFAARCPLATATCTAGPVSMARLDDGRESRCVRVDEIVAAGGMVHAIRAQAKETTR